MCGVSSVRREVFKVSRSVAIEQCDVKKNRLMGRFCLPIVCPLRIISFWNVFAYTQEVDVEGEEC